MSDRTHQLTQPRTVLVDADLVAYRFAQNANDVKSMCSGIDCFLYDIKHACKANRLVNFLSGKNDFRRQLWPDYKANREDQPKPELLRAAKTHVFSEYESECHPELEADDLIGLRATDGSYANPVIASGDKDLGCVPGWHFQPFNYGPKNPGSAFPHRVTIEQASQSLFCQLLTGDRTDNIVGLDQVGAATAFDFITRKGQPVRGLKQIHVDEQDSITQDYWEGGRGANAAIEAARNVYGYLGLEEQFKKTLPQICIWRRQMPEALLDYPRIRELSESIKPKGA